MNLFRVYAYAVEPQRTIDVVRPPLGGAIRLREEIRAALEEALEQTQRESKIQVDFRVDTTTRTNETRDLIRRFSFGTTAQAKTAADSLAQRLSGAMDRRSSACLFKFRGGERGPSIELLKDIFSRTSRLRKAALFEGQDRRTDFLRGSVLDFQAGSVHHEVADFWIVRFLDAQLGIHGPAGTRQLAKCLHKAYEAVESPEEQEQIYSAIVSVRRSPKKRWSLREFAGHYLEGSVKSAFLDSAPNEETLDSTFDFQRDVFDGSLNFRVFGLDSGVYVSAPFGEIGKSVVVSGQKEKHLRCEGKIICGRRGCRYPGVIWVKADEEEQFQKGEGIFEIHTNSAKVRVQD